MNNETVTRGIFYCRDSAKMKGCGSLQTSLRLDSVVLRNRQQKHTAHRCSQWQNYTSKIFTTLISEIPIKT